MGVGLWRASYFLRSILKEGPREGYNIAVAKHLGFLQMEKSAWLLPPLESESSLSKEVHFLTGSSHAYQTIFCAYSLRLFASGVGVNPVLHDDGTLTTDVGNRVRALLPGTRIVSDAEAVQAAEAFLPRDKFPSLWSARSQFVLMRKLMDVHASAPGWKLFLDSDMLFFRRPDVLLHWLMAPDLAVCMTDAMNSYGYQDAALASRLRDPLPDFVNTGICGLSREQIDWERLEYWCQSLTAEYGINHFLEQTLTAMLFAETQFRMMPRKDYVVAPLREQILPAPVGALHHYVADSRTFLYRFGWRRIWEAALQRSGS